MALETLDSQIDIRDLNIETPPAPREQELFFAADKKITPELMDRMRKEVEDMVFKSQHFADDFAVDFIKILGGEVSEVTRVRLWQFSALTIERGIERLTKENDSTTASETADIIRAASRLRLLFPENWSEVLTMIKDITPGQINESLHHLAFLEDYSTFAPFLGDLKIVFPDQFKDRMQNGMVQHALTKINDKHLSGTDLEERLMLLAALRLIDSDLVPQLRADTQLGRTVQAYWEQLYEETQNTPIRLVDTLAELKILAAEKVIVDENGIKLVMPAKESASGDSSTLPQTRKF